MSNRHSRLALIAQAITVGVPLAAMMDTRGTFSHGVTSAKPHDPDRLKAAEEKRVRKAAKKGGAR